MNDLEQLIARTMRAHDVEAPPASDLSLRFPELATSRRSVRWLAVAATVVAVLVASSVAVLAGHRGRPHAAPTPPASAASRPLRCPAEYRGVLKAWVPTLPQGVDGTSRLVPQEKPTSAVVCAYLRAKGRSLSGSRQLAGDLAGLTAELAWQPPAAPNQHNVDPCSANLTPLDENNYLVSRVVSSLTVWDDGVCRHPCWRSVTRTGRRWSRGPVPRQSLLGGPSGRASCWPSRPARERRMPPGSSACRDRP